MKYWDIVQDTLSQKGVTDFPHCPICKKGMFSYIEGAQLMKKVDPVTKKVDNSMDFAYLAFTCKNCGNTLFLNSTILGLELAASKDKS